MNFYLFSFNFHGDLLFLPSSAKVETDFVSLFFLNELALEFSSPGFFMIPALRWAKTMDFEEYSALCCVYDGSNIFLCLSPSSAEENINVVLMSVLYSFSNMS